MSFVLEAEAIKHSPLRGAAKYIHVLLANHADNKTGKCFPKQETLAAEAGCSVRYVRKVLAQLVSLGLIEVNQRSGPGNYHEYRVLPNGSSSSGSNGSSSSGSNGSSSSGSNRNSSAPSYEEQPEEQPEEQSEEETPSAPAARSKAKHHSDDQRQDDSMHYPNGTDPDSWDKPQTKPKPKRTTNPDMEPQAGTYKRCLWKFSRKAKEVGHPVYGVGMLHRGLSGLHKGEGKALRAYSWAEVEKLIDVFFARHAQHLRSDTKDIAAAFIYLLPQVQKEAKDSLKYAGGSTGRTNQQDEVAESLRRFQSA